MKAQVCFFFKLLKYIKVNKNKDINILTNNIMGLLYWILVIYINKIIFSISSIDNNIYIPPIFWDKGDGSFCPTFIYSNNNL